MGQRLKNKIALITGAGMGMGREASVLFAEEMASARILPDLMCWENSESPEIPAVTWPPMIADTASPPPLNGT